MNLTPIVCSACGISGSAFLLLGFLGGKPLGEGGHRGLLGLLAGLGQVAAFGV